MDVIYGVHLTLLPQGFRVVSILSRLTRFIQKTEQKYYIRNSVNSYWGYIKKPQIQQFYQNLADSLFILIL